MNSLRRCVTHDVGAKRRIYLFMGFCTAFSTQPHTVTFQIPVTERPQDGIQIYGRNVQSLPNLIFGVKLSVGWHAMRHFHIGPIPRDTWQNWD
jgi:hypothetical protein